MTNQRERIVTALTQRASSGSKIVQGVLGLKEAIEIVERELPESQWQPIETAPIDGTQFIAFWDFAPNDCEVTYWEGWDSWDEPPTHWMPLPAPPEVSHE